MRLERYIENFKELGIWLGRTIPKVGDIVAFEDKDKADSRGLGVVKDLEDSRMIVFKSEQGRGETEHWNWSDRRIVGYARPGL